MANKNDLSLDEPLRWSVCENVPLVLKVSTVVKRYKSDSYFELTLSVKASLRGNLDQRVSRDVLSNAYSWSSQ